MTIAPKYVMSDNFWKIIGGTNAAGHLLIPSAWISIPQPFGVCGAPTHKME